MSEQIVAGIHAVIALLNNPHRTIMRIFLNKDRHDVRINKIEEMAENIPIERLSTQEMERFTGLVHQGVVAIAKPLPNYTEHHIPELLAAITKKPLILILDGITDPHNLGACLRTADAAGCDFVIIPKDKNATITPIVSKVASGAVESVPLVRATNLARAIRTLKEYGVWIYGAAGEANNSLYQLDATIPIAIIMGAEDTGMRRLTRDLCDGLFSIPMQGLVSSLNVSVATGVSLYEVRRQRFK